MTCNIYPREHSSPPLLGSRASPHLISLDLLGSRASPHLISSHLTSSPSIYKHNALLTCSVVSDHCRMHRCRWSLLLLTRFHLRLAC